MPRYREPGRGRGGAETNEMARTPASQRPDTEREEFARAVVGSRSPARIAGVVASGEDGATGTPSIDVGGQYSPDA